FPRPCSRLTFQRRQNPIRATCMRCNGNAPSRRDQVEQLLERLIGLRRCGRKISNATRTDCPLQLICRSHSREQTEKMHSFTGTCLESDEHLNAGGTDRLSQCARTCDAEVICNSDYLHARCQARSDNSIVVVSLIRVSGRLRMALHVVKGI